jgi:histidine triad (HIT) family protein
MIAECVFCEIIASRAPADFAYQDDLTVAFIDPRQHNPGHVLVVPRAHINDIKQLEPQAGEIRAELATGMWQRTAVREANQSHAFDFAGVGRGHDAPTARPTENIPAAFQEVPHMHVHVHPRRMGDGLLRVYPGAPVDADPVVRASYAARLRNALA